MITREELNRLKSVDVRTVDKSSLTNIKDISVNTNIDTQKRILQFIEKTQNPYCLMINGIAVKFAFAESGCGLEECVRGYLKGKLG